MEVREPKEGEKKVFNTIVTHPLQAWEWGEFREKTGIKVIRRIGFDKSKAVYAFQLTIHKIPRTKYTLGYIPKGLLPTQEIIEELKKIGRKENCIFIKLEPNVVRNQELRIRNYGLQLSSHPLFTKFTFHLDLTKSEEELLKNMHQKTRYNIRVAQKRGVEVMEDNSDKAFRNYLKLMEETTKRQRYYAHDEEYHQKMWQMLKSQKSTLRLPFDNAQGRRSGQEVKSQKLSAHLLIAKYKGQVLVAWIVLIFNGVLYYPYGASTSQHREVMASNLMMWEAIKFGQKMECHTFDMWGSLGPNPNLKDPWYGFHRFKEGYGGELIEFVGSYDLVLNPFLYKLYNLAHRARWLYLRGKKLAG
ncbi:peptidoglycan bridge formation glycyltransferase FemA/FemB family protein [Candidatus Microgenomates bacterium]|nr:peptidoglycan bridge formation glycyltransferase FemA/FemB family protein [Candidatus Microgenomates bacterium]